MIKAVAKFFNAIHWAVGITTLPADATPQQERAFAVMWIVIVLVLLIWFAVLIYLLR